MKKRLTTVFILLCIIMTIGFIGCTSTLEPALKERKSGSTGVSELDAENLLTTENGFMFPGISWGLQVKEISSITDRTLSGIGGIGDNYIIYEAPGAAFTISGRRADEVDVMFIDDVSVRVSAVFTKDSDYASDDLSMSQLFENGLEKFENLFGEAECTENTSTVNSITAKSIYYTWSEYDKNGVETQLQWARADTTGDEEPDYISFGVLYLSDEVKAAFESDTDE